MIADYYLMHKNKIVTLIRMDSEGHVLFFDAVKAQKELLPICNWEKENWFSVWWTNRSVPIKQDGIKKILTDNNINIPEEFLMKNLGLSLNDCYWIKPIDFALKWKDVNFFENDFRTGILYPQNNNETQKVIPYTPNSSLNGMLEKTWAIQNNKRFLVKGNKIGLPLQSLNEYIASKIHKEQKYNNFVDYQLIKLANKRYKYGSICENFCSEELEFISVWDICQNIQKKTDDLYEDFIRVCNDKGIDKHDLRHHLEYQIMTDFLISNNDRHLQNMGILRNSKTLAFEKPAPIFDSGNSLFFDSVISTQRKALMECEANSFNMTEKEMMVKIKDREIVDIEKLPDGTWIKNLYLKYKIPQERAEAAARAFDEKVRMLKDFQKGNLFPEQKEKWYINNMQSYYLREFGLTFESTMDDVFSKVKMEEYEDKKKDIVHIIEILYGLDRKTANELVEAEIRQRKC